MTTLSSFVAAVVPALRASGHAAPCSAPLDIPLHACFAHGDSLSFFSLHSAHDGALPMEDASQLPVRLGVFKGVAVCVELPCGLYVLDPRFVRGVVLVKPPPGQPLPPYVAVMSAPGDVVMRLWPKPGGDAPESTVAQAAAVARFIRTHLTLEGFSQVAASRASLAGSPEGLSPLGASAAGVGAVSQVFPTGSTPVGSQPPPDEEAEASQPQPPGSQPAGDVDVGDARPPTPPGELTPSAAATAAAAGTGASSDSPGTTVAGVPSVHPGDVVDALGAVTDALLSVACRPTWARRDARLGASWGASHLPLKLQDAATAMAGWSQKVPAAEDAGAALDGTVSGAEAALEAAIGAKFSSGASPGTGWDDIKAAWQRVLAADAAGLAGGV